VKFVGSKGRVDGHKIRFTLGAWFSCDKQKDRQEGLFFSQMDEKLNVVGISYIWGSAGLIRRRQMVSDSM